MAGVRKGIREKLATRERKGAFNGGSDKTGAIRSAIYLTSVEKPCKRN